MAHRVQPQTTQGHGGYDYGSQPISFDGEGARRVRTGGFGPDATQIQSQGQSSFRRMYDQIRKADERQQEGDDKPKVMESNPVDEFMSNLYRIGENISQPVAVRDLQESDNPVENLAGFAIGLPFGTIGAIPQGVAQGYEAFSGRGVIDEDREEGTVRILDSNQRAASAVNAGINLVGTAFGGSGSMIRGGYRAARTGLARLGGEAAEQGAKKAAANALKDTAEKFLSPANIKRVAGESAEEAGEEFIQSFADDARYGTSDEGSLGRALESAAWGAAGGAMMSTGGYGLNKLASKWGGENAGDNSDDPTQGRSDIRDNSQYNLQYGDQGQKRFVTPAVQEAARNRVEGKNLNWPGSQSVTLIQSNDKSMGVNQSRIGTNTFRDIWMAPDNGKSSSIIESQLGMTHDEAVKMFNSADWSSQLIERFNQIKSGDGKVRMYWARNPATKGRQPVMVDVDQVFDGDGLMLHPMVMPLVGADTDGDKMFATFNSDATDNAMYATSLLVDPETGASTLGEDEWMRSGIATSLKRKTVEKIVRDVLVGQSATYAGDRGMNETSALRGNEELAVDTAKAITDALDAVNGDTKGDYAALGDAIEGFGAALRSSNLDGDAAIQSLIIALATNEESSAMAGVERIINSAPAPEFTGADVERSAGQERSGSTPKGYTYAHLLSDWNLLTYAIGNKGNPAFRQLGEHGYHGKAVPSYITMIDDIAKRVVDITGREFNDTSKFTNFMVSCLKELNRGSSVENAVAGKLSSYVAAKTILDSGLSTNRVSSFSDMEAVLRAFCEARTQAAEWSNEARKILTDRGWSSDSDALEMKELVYHENASSDPKIMNEFVRIMGGQPADAIMDTSHWPVATDGMTINEVVDYLDGKIDGRSVDSHVEFKSTGDGFYQKIFETMVEARYLNRKIVSSNVQEMIGNISDVFARLSRYAQDGIIDRNHLAEASYALNALDYIIGANEAMEIGAYDPETFLRSEWGREIASGDRKRAIRAVVSMSLTGQFRPVIDLYGKASNDFERNYAIYRMNEMARISPLHELIVTQLIANEGRSDYLDALTSLDYDYDSMMNEFSAHFDTESGKNDLVLMALTNKVSEFDMTDINARRRKAKSSYNTGIKFSYESAKSEVSVIESMLKTGEVSEQMLVGCLEDLASNSIITMDNSALAAMICDSAGLSNKSLEKATIEYAAQFYGMGVQLMVSGGVSAETDMAINQPILRMPINQFSTNRVMLLGVLSGRFDHVYVYDPSMPGSPDVRISRDSIFRRYCGGSWKDGQTPTTNDWLNLLKQQPQLITMLAPHSVQHSLAEGITSTKSGMAQTVESYMKQYTKRYSTTGRDESHRAWEMEAKRRIRNEIRRVPGLPARIVQTIPGFDQKISDPRAIRRECDRILDEIVNATYDRIMIPEGGDSYQKMRMVEKAEQISSIIDDITLMIRNTKIMTMGLDLNDNIRRTLEQNTRSLLADTAYSTAMSMAIMNMSDSNSPINIGMETDSRYDDLLNAANRAYDDIRETIEQIIPIYRVVMEFSDVDAFNAVFSVSDEMKRRVIEEIDENENLTDAQRESLRASASNAASAITSAFLDDNSVASTVVTDADVNPAISQTGTDQMKADLKRKAREIWRHGYEAYPSDYDQRIDDAIDGATSEAVADRQRIKLDLDSRFLQTYIRNLDMSTGAKPNANLLRAMVESRDVDMEIERAARKAMSDWPKYVDGTYESDPSGYVHRMPTAHFVSPVAQAAVTKLNSTDVSASLVPTKTGVNGANYRAYAGFAVLPNQRICDVAPRPITAAELTRIATSANPPFDLETVHVVGRNMTNLNWTYVKKNQGIDWTLSTFTPEMIQNICSGYYPQDTVFYVFVPDDCADGLCVAHQETPVGADTDGYLSIPNIINRINQFAQETMNIKMKKSPSSLDILGDDIPGSIANDHAVAIASDPNGIVDEDSIKDMNSWFRGTRGRVKNHLNRWLTSDRMSKLGYGMKQARQLSMVMVQGLNITLEGRNGTVQRIAPKASFSDPASFKSWIDKVRAETGDQTIVPVSAKDYIMTLDELSMSSMMNVISHYGEDLGKDDIERYALQGMTDLSRIRPGSLDVDDVLSMVNPVGMAFDNAVAVASSPAGASAFLDIMNDTSVHTLTDSMSNKGLESITERQAASIDRINASYSSDGVKFTNYKNYRIYKVFSPAAPQAGYTLTSIGERQVVASMANDMQNELGDIEDDRYMASGMAIAFDAEGAKRAISWARTHQQPFAVPEVIVKDQGMDALNNFYPIKKTLMHNGQQVTLNVYNPSVYEDFIGLSRSTATSQLNPTASKVMACMPSTPGMLLADAGSLLNADTAGYITIENNTMEGGTIAHYLANGVRGRTRMATSAELREAVKMMRIGNLSRINLHYLRDTLHMSEQDVDASINEFVRWYGDDDGKHSVKSTARPGDIVAMVVTTNEATGNKVYSPIVIDRSEIDDDLTAVTVDKTGDSIVMSYNSRTNMADTLRGDGKPRLYGHKIALNGVSFKSMGTVIEPGDFRNVAGSDMPTIRATVDGVRKPIDIVVDSGALDGRMNEKEEPVCVSNLWWYMHGDKTDPSGRSNNPIFHAFFKTDDKGVTRMSDDFKSVIQQGNGKFTREVLVDLFAGTGNIAPGGAWSRVASGELPMSTDPEISKIIKNIAARCINHRISPNHVFGNTNITESILNSMIPDADGVYPFGYNGKLAFSSPTIDYTMIFCMDKPDLFKLYNFIDKRLCPVSEDADDGSTVFDYNGNTYVSMGYDPDTGEEILSKQPVIWGPVHALGVTSQEGTPSTQAKRGAQMRASQSFDSGLMDNDTDFFVEWFAEIVDRPDIIEAVRDKSRMFPDDDDFAKDIGYTDDPDYLNQVVTARFSSALQQKYERDLRDTGKIFANPIPFQDIDGTVVSNPSDLMRNQYVSSSIRRLNNALKGDGSGRCVPLNIDQVLVMYACSSGQTINSNEIKEYPSIRQFTSFIDEMTDNVKSDGIPIKVRRTNIDDRGRYAVAMLPMRFAEELYASSPAIRKFFGERGFDGFKNAMLEENKACVDAINTIKNDGKRKALLRLVDFLCLDWGIEPSSGHIYANTYLRDMFDTDDIALKAMSQYLFSPNQVKWFRERAKEQSEKIYNIARSNDTRIKRTADSDIGRNGELLRYESRNRSGAEKFLRSASELSRFMAMLNPFIATANIVDRAVNQGMTNAAMVFCLNNGVGPFKSSFTPDQDKVKMGADSIDAEKVFDLLRYAAYDGDEARVLSGIRTMDDVDSYLADRRQSMENDKLLFIPRKAVDFVFEWSGGGNIMSKYQRRNWFNQFSRIIASDDFNEGLNGEPNPLLAKVPGSEDTTLLELQWAQEPAKLLVQVFGNINNPYHSAAVRALNFSRRGEACQQNILSVIYSSLAKRYPAVEFFTTTCVSRFFLYSTNMTGRVLNLVAPMSSINYMINDVAAKLDTGNRFNFGDLQMYTNLKEAIAVDAMHMAPGVLAILLASIGGLFTPPDDEDKMGNYDEWLIGGHRIGEDWMLQDVLGLSGPLACFFTSAINGYPRFDLITNGFMDVCYNNPVIKASTAIEILKDPESAFLSDFEEDSARYENAPGGSPDALSWLGGKMFSGALSWSSQFVTPSIAREICNSVEFQPYERAYRYVVATDARGNAVIDPDTGMPTYQETSYLDAQIRRVARTNPVIGLFADIATGAWVSGNTGYTAWEQPRTVYYDDAQLEYMRLFSVNDENGDPLPADQQQEKIYMVLSVLMQNDDMDELAATGFYLDYDTKMMVGDTIHDIIQNMRDNYSDLNAAGFFDYYYGGLSYEEGRARAEQLKSEYYDELAFWQDLYYNKLWSEPLKKKLTVYNRYNTTYAQDANAQWKATGRSNSSNPPYRRAPAAIYDQVGTA